MIHWVLKKYPCPGQKNNEKNESLDKIEIDDVEIYKVGAPC